jgi:hypothetical protein
MVTVTAVNSRVPATVFRFKIRTRCLSCVFIRSSVKTGGQVLELHELFRHQSAA